jgi:putative PEP-CTERM system TPR-repeat lipoprotein
VHVVAGEIALARKQPAKAEAHFARAAAISPESAAIRTELGISRMAQGERAGLADLDAATRLEGGGGRAETLLILAQLKNREFDAALATIDKLAKKMPQSPVPHNLRGAVFLGKGDPARARESFEAALKRDPRFFPAAANLARLDMKDNQPAAARARFESVLKADPRHLQAMLALAELARAEKDEKAYLGWLEKAASANPQSSQPRLLLARYWLAKGDSAKAVAATREAANAQPDNAAALDLLGATQFAAKDFDNALGTYRKLADRFPNQAEPLLKLAQVHAARKEPDEARRRIEEAIRVKPDLIDAKLMLGNLEINSGRADQALKLAKAIEQQKPDSPAGWSLEGDALLAKKQYPAALAAFERAYRLAPSPATLIRVHLALAGAGRVEEGEKRLAEWLAAHPDDRGTRRYLADRLVGRGQFKSAADQYLILNQQVPGNAEMLNNLAWALFQLKDPRALGFAEQALKRQPDNAGILDTYGWLLANNGQAPRGIEQLRKAVSKAPDVPDIRWHLASALAMAGDRERARQELENLLASGRGFPNEAQARQLLESLRHK